MDPLILLFIGISAIIICILILKLHPVLALLFAAIIVGLITSDNNLEQFARSQGMTEGETLKTYSSVLSIMGFVGMFVIIFAKLFPII